VRDACHALFQPAVRGLARHPVGEVCVCVCVCVCERERSLKVRGREYSG